MNLVESLSGPSSACAFPQADDGSDKKPEFVGTLAVENPWEGLHKIRNGQPGSPMPAWRGFDIQHAVDVLTYSQTLPVK